MEYHRFRWYWVLSYAHIPGRNRSRPALKNCRNSHRFSQEKKHQWPPHKPIAVGSNIPFLLGSNIFIFKNRHHHTYCWKWYKLPKLFKNGYSLKASRSNYLALAFCPLGRNVSEDFINCIIQYPQYIRTIGKKLLHVSAKERFASLETDHIFSIWTTPTVYSFFSQQLRSWFANN